MSLLDDARKMVEAGPFDDGNAEYYRKCIFCGAEPDELPPTIYGYKGHPSQPHKADCPWLSMPKIVATLEAAERVTEVRAVVLEEAVTDLEIALKGEST